MEVWKLSEGRYKCLNPNFEKVPKRISDSRSDVRLLVGKQQFRAHRDVLSSNSDYFQTMFSVDMKEKEEKDIKLHELDPDGFSRIMDYFYRGYITIDLDVAEPILEASCFIQSGWLVHASCDFLIRHASMQNYEHVLELADRFALGDLHTDIFNFLGLSFMEVSQAPAFLEMSAALLHELLSEDYYVEAPEACVMASVMSWLEHDPERQELREMMLTNVKFALVEASALEGLPSWVGEVEAVKPLLEHAAKYQENVFGQAVLDGPETAPRGGRDVLALLPTSAAGVMRLMEPSTGMSISENFDGSGLDCQLDYAGIVRWGNFLYFVGGYSPLCLSTDVVYRLAIADTMRRSWIQAASLKTPRVTFGLAVTERHLWAIGGINHVVLDGRDTDLYLPSVERYDAVKNEWEDVQALPHGLCELAVTAVGNQLYLSGGITDNDSDPVPAPYVMRYSIEEDQWHPLAPLITGRKRHAMMHHKNQLVVVGGQVAEDEHALTSVDCRANEMYDIETNQWSEITHTPDDIIFSNISPMASVIGDKAFLLGGAATSRHLLQFDLEARAFHGEGSGCGEGTYKLLALRVPLPMYLEPVNEQEGEEEEE